MSDTLFVLLPLVHAAATWFMVGLIWFVQVVHYPLKGRVPGECYPAFAIEHQQRTGYVVLPVMTVEIVTAALLVFAPHPPGTDAWRWAGLVMVVLIWVSTFAVQVPLHGRLGKGFDALACQRLVSTNWVRTVLWSLRGIVALVLVRAA